MFAKGVMGDAELGYDRFIEAEASRESKNRAPPIISHSFFFFCHRQDYLQCTGNADLYILYYRDLHFLNESYTTDQNYRFTL